MNLREFQQKGGLATNRKYGRKYMRKISLIGLAKRWKKAKNGEEKIDPLTTSEKSV